MPNRWMCFLSLLLIATAVGVAAGQAPSEKRSASEERTDSPFRDDPLGHVQPVEGAGIEAAMTENEAAAEVFCKAHVNPWATVQPTLQFISSPSGVYRDSMVAGVRFQIVL